MSWRTCSGSNPAASCATPVVLEVVDRRPSGSGGPDALQKETKPLTAQPLAAPRRDGIDPDLGVAMVVEVIVRVPDELTRANIAQIAVASAGWLGVVRDEGRLLGLGPVDATRRVVVAGVAEVPTGIERHHLRVQKPLLVDGELAQSRPVKRE